MIALTHVPPEKSSQVAAHGYHLPTQTLAIKYRSGKTWHYKNVPATEAEKFAKAESLGKHLHAHIKHQYDAEPQPEEVKS